MASGQTLLAFGAAHSHPPATNYATLDTRNSHLVLDYDASVDETAYFSAVLPRHYDGGGITVRVGGLVSSAAAGDVRLEIAFERHDPGTDLDADSFATAKSVAVAVPATSGAPIYTDLAFTDGAEIDNLAVGEHFRLMVRRDANGTTGTDSATGDFELLSVELRET